MSHESAPRRPVDPRLLVLGTWIWVGVPFGYGIYQLVQKIHPLFTT